MPTGAMRTKFLIDEKECLRGYSHTVLHSAIVNSDYGTHVIIRFTTTTTSYVVHLSVLSDEFISQIKTPSLSLTGRESFDRHEDHAMRASEGVRGDGRNFQDSIACESPPFHRVRSLDDC